MKRPDKVDFLLKSFLPPLRGLNPDHYCCEPYVLPGNVDGPDSPNYGKGGWTWYTGSAAWLYTIGWDWVLGLKPIAEGMQIDPCMPKDWNNVKGYRDYRGKKIEFVIENNNTNEVKVEANGKQLEGNILKLADFEGDDTITLKISC
jgi:cellobiose phosphorylase